MKKITYLLIAAMSLVSVASCVKELTPEPAFFDGVAQEFTVTLPAATRTALVEGKTVWAKGDSLWVYNGVSSESVVVPEEAWGQKEFKFIVKTATFSDTTKTIYVVYPYAAAGGVTDGQVKVKIPGVQDGRFATANIAAAVSEDYNVNLKNVTAVLKVNVPAETEAPIYALSISAANANPLTGTCAVDFSGETPALIPPTSAGSDLTVQVDGLPGDFYAAVIPGTYDAGFRLLAATTDFAHASESKETTVANTVKVNDLVDLGSIGTNLAPLSGDGSEANPWLLESLGHVIAFASAVNDGESFAGQFVKLGADISGITVPIGSLAVTYASSSYTVTGAPFQGHFDGAGHTMTVNITASTAGRSTRVGLFGGLSDGAVVENLVIDGKVSLGGCNTIGGLAGSVYSDENGVTIKNVTNKAAVNGNNQIGGLVGEASANIANKMVFENCRNEGTVTGGSYGVGGIVGRAVNKAVNKSFTACVNTGAVKGQYDIGGIVGYSYYGIVTDCENSGTVESTSNGVSALYAVSNGKFTVSSHGGAGGVTGWTQNSTVKNCKNSGAITGPTKVGGVTAASYWTGLTDCENTGTITCTGNTCGGVIGWAATSGTQTRCVNKGAVTGNNYVGGIAGYADAMGTSSGSANLRFNNCVNHGVVKANTESAGGIVGYAKSYNKSSSYNVHPEMNGCINAEDAEVYAQYRAGGILGSFSVYANAAVGNIRNCENYGTIVGTRTDKDGGEVAGGILGCTLNTPSGEGAGIHVANCLNAGKVQYSDVSHVGVYCGGIVGRFLAGSIKNVANLGTVGPVSGTPGEGIAARLGSIVGSLENCGTRSFLEEAYSIAGIAENFVGTASVAADAFPEACPNVRVFDAEGALQELVVISGKDSYVVDEALNAWVAANTDYTYYTWAWGETLTFVKE